MLRGEPELPSELEETSAFDGPQAMPSLHRLATAAPFPQSTSMSSSLMNATQHLHPVEAGAGVL